MYVTAEKKQATTDRSIASATHHWICFLRVVDNSLVHNLVEVTMTTHSADFLRQKMKKP